MSIDPKWLEILKVSGWQTTALAMSFGAFILCVRSGIIIIPDGWEVIVPFSWLCLLICVFLSLASITQKVWECIKEKYDKYKRKRDKKIKDKNELRVLVYLYENYRGFNYLRTIRRIAKELDLNEQRTRHYFNVLNIKGLMGSRLESYEDDADFLGWITDEGLAYVIENGLCKNFKKIPKKPDKITSLRHLTQNHPPE